MPKRYVGLKIRTQYRNYLLGLDGTPNFDYFTRILAVRTRFSSIPILIIPNSVQLKIWQEATISSLTTKPLSTEPHDAYLRPEGPFCPRRRPHGKGRLFKQVKHLIIRVDKYEKRNRTEKRILNPYSESG